jgi:hypothetical protein
MKKINKVYPINRKDVLLSGINTLTNEKVKVIGYRIKSEKRFVTPPKGWCVNFTHYEEL